MLSDVRSVIDIAIVSFIIYRILVLLVGTRAVQLVKGVLILVAVSALASWFRMRLLSWFIGSALLALSFAVPIVFQPELRKMLEELGKGQFYLLKPKMSDDEADVRAKQVAGALNYLKAHKIGALLVLQREVGLADYYNTAIHLNSNITQELLISIFWKDNPLHDGAVILDRFRLIAGGCYLPLADAPVFGLDFSVVFFWGGLVRPYSFSFLNLSCVPYPISEMVVLFVVVGLLSFLPQLAPYRRKGRLFRD